MVRAHRKKGNYGDPRLDKVPRACYSGQIGLPSDQYLDAMLYDKMATGHSP
jgi:hypothetical protein